MACAELVRASSRFSDAGCVPGYKTCGVERVGCPIELVNKLAIFMTYFSGGGMYPCNVRERESQRTARPYGRFGKVRVAGY